MIKKVEGIVMKRIDKIISEQTNYTRKEIKKLIMQGVVLVNENVIKKPEEKYDEEKIEIIINDKKVKIKRHIYLLLNKPKGYVSTTDTLHERSVLEFVPDEFKTRELFPAGRLDKDTTGLMLITDDGEFAHNILSPKKHVKKIYEVTIDIPITNSMIKGFEKGVNLSDGECKTAKLEVISEYVAKVTITEGRYHQIKRMFGCYGAKVVELNRICIGDLFLPKDLKLGEIREAEERELEKISERK